MHVLTKHACRLFCQTTCVYIRTCPPYEPQALFFIQEHYSAAVTLLNATEKLTIIVANSLDPERMFTFASNNIGAQSTHNTHVYMHKHDYLHIAQFVTCAAIEARSIAMNHSGSVQFDGRAAANITVSIPESIVRGKG